MQEHKVTVDVAGGQAALVRWPRVVHPGDTIVVEVRDFDTEGCLEEELVLEEDGRPYVGGPQAEIWVEERTSA